MDLRLKFINVNDNDVVATSGVVATPGPCAYLSSAAAYKYEEEVSGYYLFIIGADNTKNNPDYNFLGSPGYTSIVDKNGNNLGSSIAPTTGKYYHYDNVPNSCLYECENENHHVTFQ